MGLPMIFSLIFKVYGLRGVKDLKLHAVNRKIFFECFKLFRIIIQADGGSYAYLLNIKPELYRLRIRPLIQNRIINNADLGRNPAIPVVKFEGEFISGHLL